MNNQMDLLMQNTLTGWAGVDCYAWLAGGHLTLSYQTTYPTI